MFVCFAARTEEPTRYDSSIYSIRLSVFERDVRYWAAGESRYSVQTGVRILSPGMPKHFSLTEWITVMELLNWWAAAHYTIIVGSDKNLKTFCLNSYVRYLLLRVMVRPWKAGNYLKIRLSVRFRIIRMAFYIRDNHEMRRSRVPHRQMPSRLRE